MDVFLLFFELMICWMYSLERIGDAILMSTYNIHFMIK